MAGNAGRRDRRSPADLRQHADRQRRRSAVRSRWPRIFPGAPGMLKALPSDRLRLRRAPCPPPPRPPSRSIAESALRAADGSSSVCAWLYALFRRIARLRGRRESLESTWGITPAAVVMLDTLSFQHGDGDGIDYPELMRINFSRPEQAPVRLTNSRLSAMGCWLALLRGLEAAPTSVPALLVRCTKPLYEGQFASRLRAGPRTRCRNGHRPPGRR